MNTLLENALNYAELGWKVFPLAPGKKTPITSHGVKDASVDEATIRAWWAKWPDANIAVACGATSGVYVIDVDVDEEKGISGIESLVTEFDPLPATVQQSTPRGGFHVFYKTEVPPANRNSFRPGIDIRGDGYYVVLAPSIHPNGGIYCWKHGCAPWEVSIAEYPDCMRSPVTKNVVEFKGAPIYTTPSLDTPINDLLARATLYVHECDPAVEGLGGHNNLFWAAQCMVNGFRLSDSQAFSILASDYNPMCSPPWNLSDASDYKDFYRKILEARKTPPRDKRVGWLLDEFNLSDSDLLAAAEDTRSMLAAMEPEDSTVTPRIDYDLLEDEKLKKLRLLQVEHDFLVKPTGFLGELCSWINETSLRYQPLLTLGCSLTFLGALFGRKVRDTLGNRTNLYCMGIGDSSAGKGHGPEQIFRLCEASNCLDLIGGSNTTSDSGIEERLANNPSTLFFWDEIGHLLSDFRSSSHKALVVPTLMSIWSSARRTYLGREYADKEKQRKIVQPNLCIWGSTTPDRFSRGLSTEEVRDGWIGRVLAYQTTTRPPINENYAEEPVPEHLIKTCTEWSGRGKKIINGTDLTTFVTASFADTPPTQIVVPLTQEAKACMKSFRAWTEKKATETTDMEYLWAKSVEQVHRIALIVAASEGTPEIEVDEKIANYACRLVGYLVEEFGKTILPRIAGSETEFAKLKILDVVGSFGKKGCPKALLTRKTQWATGVSRDNMVKDLVEAGQLLVEKSGRTIFFWTEEHYTKIPDA